MGEELRVVVIGGSKTAAQLITDFVSRPFLRLIGVADFSESSPGAITARQFAIPFTTDIHDFGALDPAPDVVIDVCGRPHVNPALDETFPNESQGPTVIHSTGARLVLSLAADSSSLVPECMATIAGADL